MIPLMARDRLASRAPLPFHSQPEHAALPCLPIHIHSLSLRSPPLPFHSQPEPHHCRSIHSYAGFPLGGASLFNSFRAEPAAAPFLDFGLAASPPPPLPPGRHIMCEAGHTRSVLL